jgi:hypothetical protein
MKKGLLFTFLFSIYHICAFAQTSEVISINNRNHAMLIIAKIGTMMDQGTQSLVNKLRTKDSVNFNNVYKHIRFMMNGSLQHSCIDQYVKSIGSSTYILEYQSLFLRILLRTKWLSIPVDNLSLEFDAYDVLTECMIIIDKKNKVRVDNKHLLSTIITRQELEKQGLKYSLTEF